MDPRGKHVWPPDSMRRTMERGEGFGREKSEEPAFEKPWKSPKTKPGQEQSSWSSIEIRHAEVGRGAMENDEVEEGFRRKKASLSKFDSCDRRSKISSPFMRLAPLATPLKHLFPKWFRRSIKETSNSWETFMRAWNRLRENFQILKNLPFFFFFFLIRIWTIGCRFSNQDFWDIINSNRFWYLFV